MNHHRNGFTLVELIVVILIILMLIALLLPARRTVGEAARRNNCSNAVRQILLATLNHENATGRFPNVMNGAAAVSTIDVHGPAPFANDDGYSFHVTLLSYMEENLLFDKISNASVGFQEPINSQVFQQGSSSVWDQPVELLICPSFPGENLALGRYRPVTKPQVSNYHAMVAGCVNGTQQEFGDLDPATGGIIVTRQTAPKGLGMDDITDGTSKTIMLTESRSEVWTAWFSGVSTATVAIPPDVATCDRMATSEVDPAAFPKLPSGLNYGRRSSDTTGIQPYFWASRKDQRDWGPSSAHAGNVVMTGYADGHVKGLNAGINATTYFWLSTRGGGEPADDE